MRPVIKILCLVLALLWVPLTKHCALEAAGILAPQCSQTCSDGEACDGDACTQFENASYKLGTTLLKVPAPALLACARAIWIGPTPLEIASLEIIPPDAAEHPRGWVASWQFVRRAAPPSRAPSSMMA